MKKILLLVILIIATHAKAQLSSCSASFNYSINNLSVTFTDSSYGTTVPTDWNWSFGDGGTSTLQNPVYTYSQAGTFSVCLTVYKPFTNCQSTFCDTITITSTPACINPAQIDSSMICTPVFSPVCGCDSVTYNNSCEAYYYGGVTSYTNGPCGSQGNCYTSFWYYPDSSNQSTINFYDASSFGTITYQWDFGDSSTSSLSNPVHTYAQDGQYNVCLITADTTGCSDTLCQVVYVSTPANCTAFFSWSPDSVDPNTLFFYDFSSGNITGWQWDFGDGNSSALSNPSHTYSADGNYLVCLIIEDSALSCTDTFCTTVYAGFQGNCQAYFAYVPDTSDPYTLNFSDLSAGNPVAWSWSLGDGSSSTLQNPSHTYANAGTYQVCLYISDSSGNCTDSLCDYVTVYGFSSCTAFYTYSNPFGNWISFTDSSIGSASSYYWDFGDGTTSTQQNPFHNYPDTGVYYACLTIADSATNCYSTYCNYVYLGSSPPVCLANFTYTVTGNVVSFFDGSIGTVSNYFWTLGDNNVENLQNPVHTYTDSGYYNVCLTVSDFGTGCFNTFCDSIYIAPSPGGCTAGFTYVAYGDSVMFTDASGGNPVIWDWDFGDFQSSTQANPSHTYPFPFTYTACLTITAANGCYDTYCDSIVIVGLEESNSGNDFLIFPNPVQDKLQIHSQKNHRETLTVYISNLMGEEVYRQKIRNSSEILPLPVLSDGFYLITVEGKDINFKKKIIICN